MALNEQQFDDMYQAVAYEHAVKAGIVKCRKCGGQVKQGVAIQSTLVSSIGDFHSTDYCTFSVGGPGQLIDVYKCGECGHSYSR